LTDLMAGVALTVLIVLAAVQGQANRARAELDALRRERRPSAEQIADLERQLDEARRRLGVGAALVERIRDRLRTERIEARINAYGNLEMSADVLFSTGEASIPEEKQAEALRVGQVVFDMLSDKEQSRAIALMTVVGHTDQVGTDENNRSLSTRRALALVNLWHANLPLSDAARRCVTAKLVAAGLGESRPAVPDESPEACGNGDEDYSGCRANRRIEIRITPKEEKVSEVIGCS